jgi:hypothetical protein
MKPGRSGCADRGVARRSIKSTFNPSRGVVSRQFFAQDQYGTQRAARTTADVMEWAARRHVPGGPT